VIVVEYSHQVQRTVVGLEISALFEILIRVFDSQFQDISCIVAVTPYQLRGREIIGFTGAVTSISIVIIISSPIFHDASVCITSI
jgi:hypothetical protein